MLVFGILVFGISYLVLVHLPRRLGILAESVIFYQIPANPEHLVAQSEDPLQELPAGDPRDTQIITTIHPGGAAAHSMRR